MPGFAIRSSSCLAAVVLLAASLSACGGARSDEASQISAFLSAAQTDNRMVFESQVDRGRVRDDLRDQFARIPGVQDLQAQIGEGVGDGALDRMISPETIRRLEKASGATGEKAADLQGRLKGLGVGRVCLKDEKVHDRCLMTFAKQDKVWKLVGLYAEPQSFAPPAEAPLVGSIDDIPEN